MQTESVVMFKEARRRPDPAAGPAWCPPQDAVLDHLLREALSGGLPVYLASVPLGRLRRFRDEFRPERTPAGRRVVQAIFEQWHADAPPCLWVYPRGEAFVVSDDYFTLAAVERRRPDHVPCWVLGPVSGSGVRELRGPVDPRGLRRLLGVH